MPNPLYSLAKPSGIFTDKSNPFLLQYPLEEVFNQLHLESKGLVDSNIYLTEEGSELHWKKNVFPAISEFLDYFSWNSIFDSDDKLNEMIRKSVRFDKNKEMEPVPISNEFILEKLEEMQVNFTFRLVLQG